MYRPQAYSVELKHRENSPELLASAYGVLANPYYFTEQASNMPAHRKPHVTYPITQGVQRQSVCVCACVCACVRALPLLPAYIHPLPGLLWLILRNCCQKNFPFSNKFPKLFPETTLKYCYNLSQNGFATTNIRKACASWRNGQWEVQSGFEIREGDLL